MEYIRWTGSGFDHRPYWDYQSSVGAIMPAHLLSFAANEENHNLTHPNSLHDRI